MTRKDEILQELETKRARLEEINNTVSEAKRMKNEEERTEFDNLIGEVEGLEKELKDIEKTEELSKRSFNKNVSIIDKTVKPVYSVQRAVMGLKKGKIDGVEAEIDQEMKKDYKGFSERGVVIPDVMVNKRAAIFASGSTSEISKIAQGIDIVGFDNLMSQIGVREIPVNTYIEENYGQLIASDKVAEGEAFSEKSQITLNETIMPSAFGHQTITTNENLAVNSLILAYLQEADASIRNKESAEFLQKLITGFTATTWVNGYGLDQPLSAATFQTTLDLKAAVNAMLIDPVYVAGSSLYSRLEGTAKFSGGGVGVIDSGRLNGRRVVDVFDQLPAVGDKHSLVYFDAARAKNYTFGGGMQAIFDEVTQAGQRKVVLTWSRLSKSTFNPYGAKVMRNLDVS